MDKPSSIKSGYYVLIGLFVLSSLLCASSTAQTSFKVLFEIGLDDNLEEEYLFGRPEFVVTDEDGNIYVSDLMTLDIRKFDKNGVYEKSYGKRGRGPGEFHSITAMSISEGQELVVYDARQRRITRFDTNSDSVDTFPFNYPIWPKRIMFSNSSGEWVMLAKTSPFDAGSEEQALQMIHFVSEQFILKGSTGNYSQLGAADLFHEVASQIHPGSIVEHRGKLFHAPGVYDGKIYQYEQSHAESWSQSEVLESQRYVEENITMYEESEFDPANMLKSTRMIPQSDEDETIRRVLVGRSNSQSAGLFSRNGEQLVHFVMYSPDTTAAYMSVEIYDSSGANIYRDTINVPFKDWPTRPTVYVGWRDDSDRYYLVHRTGIPHISVVELSIN